jgi:uncharacterized protein
MTLEEYRKDQEAKIKEILAMQPRNTLEDVNHDFRKKYERASQDADPVIRSLGEDLLRLGSLQRRKTPSEQFEWVKKQQRLSLEKKARRSSGLVGERARELLKDWDSIYALELAAIKASQG